MADASEGRKRLRMRAKGKEERTCTDENERELIFMELLSIAER